MTFFNSPVIRDEMEEISALCTLITNVRPSELNPNQRVTYLEMIDRVMELQQVMYFRAKYSDEEQAKSYISELQHHAVECGYPENYDISKIFTKLRDEISEVKEKLS